MIKTGEDSTGTPIRIGDKVRFRGKEYTIDRFIPGLGRFGSQAIVFAESEVHTDETPDEISVDLIQ